jgi:hypothetical protein
VNLFFSTETRFSDIPLTQKSVQWDTREPIKILEDRDANRPDSRYGSHGSIDTILRKQWIENKTESITQATSPTNQRDSYSLLGRSKQPIPYALMDTKDSQFEEKKAPGKFDNTFFL